MFDSYKDIFDRRAASYHQAMQDFPQAREQEFYWAVKYLALDSGDIICDVPSGGGYLKDYATEKSYYFHFLETSESFAAHSAIYENSTTKTCQFEHLPLKDNSIDKLICLAALHHMKNRDEVFQQFKRVLKPQGKILIVDVEEYTNTANFLNVFVNQYNSMGHQGDFLNELVIEQLQDNQLNLIAINRPKLQWCFNKEEDMISFFRNLFGLDKATNEDIFSGIYCYLNPNFDGEQITLDWQLVYIELDSQGS